MTQRVTQRDRHLSKVSRHGAVVTVPRRGHSAAPSNLSRVANSATGLRVSRVGCRWGLPSGNTAATACPSGMPSSALTRGSSATAIVVNTPPNPSLRAASRTFHTNGYTDAPATTPTRSCIAYVLPWSIASVLVMTFKLLQYQARRRCWPHWQQQGFQDQILLF